MQHKTCPGCERSALPLVPSLRRPNIVLVIPCSLFFSLCLSLSLSFLPGGGGGGRQKCAVVRKGGCKAFFGEIFSRWQKSGALVKTTQKRERPPSKKKKKKKKMTTTTTTTTTKR
jgi:hypothetical protein